MKVLLWGVCCLTAFFGYMVFHLRTEKRTLEKENFMLKNKVVLYQQESTLCQESLNRYETAFNTLKKQDRTIVNRWDLLINGIVSKENRSLKNRGSEDDDDLEIHN